MIVFKDTEVARDRSNEYSDTGVDDGHRIYKQEQ